jgi:hypothetical protein
MTVSGSLVDYHLRRGELAEARSYSTQLLADARATLEDRLQHLSVLKRDQGTDLAASLRALQQHSGTNGAAIYVVAGWMIGNGLAAEAVAWLQGLPVNVRSLQPVPVALMDCYVAKEDWARLEDFLKGESWNELDFLRLAWRSRAAERRNDTLAAAEHWRAAARAAGDRFGTLAVLLQLADRWERQQDVEDLLWRIVELFRPSAGAAGTGSLRGHGNTRGQNKVYAAMLVFPKDVAQKQPGSHVLVAEFKPEAGARIGARGVRGWKSQRGVCLDLCLLAARAGQNGRGPQADANHPRNQFARANHRRLLRRSAGRGGRA